MQFLRFDYLVRKILIMMRTLKLFFDRETPKEKEKKKMKQALCRLIWNFLMRLLWFYSLFLYFLFYLIIMKSDLQDISFCVSKNQFSNSSIFYKSRKIMIWGVKKANLFIWKLFHICEKFSLFVPFVHCTHKKKLAKQGKERIIWKFSHYLMCVYKSVVTVVTEQWQYN